MPVPKDGLSVIVNCLCDAEYEPLFESLIFCLFACGFKPPCALKEEDASKIRSERIYDIISKCALGIHDL